MVFPREFIIMPDKKYTAVICQILKHLIYTRYNNLGKILQDVRDITIPYECNFILSQRDFVNDNKFQLCTVNKT